MTSLIGLWRLCFAVLTSVELMDKSHHLWCSIITTFSSFFFFQHFILMSISRLLLFSKMFNFYFVSFFLFFKFFFKLCYVFWKFIEMFFVELLLLFSFFLSLLLWSFSYLFFALSDLLGRFSLQGHCSFCTFMIKTQELFLLFDRQKKAFIISFSLKLSYGLVSS